MDRRVRITVTGIVQGVGFRPRVYRLAVAGGLKGYVLNTSKGVLIEVEGPAAEGFQKTLLANRPPLSSINTMETEELPPAGYTTFEIRLSEPADEEFSLVSPDIATCPDCLREMLDSTDRRYLYPFINCTNCGPRYSIVQGVPYDRPLTTMRKFNMCEMCRAEYDDPSDRRFHAQPVACPECGPRVEFSPVPPTPAGGGQKGGGHAAATGNDAVIQAIKALKAGMVVAIKGLGGFQLACDASNDATVSRLRERKRKSKKPFALMAADMDVIRKYCEVNEAEQNLLEDRARPIVLLKKKPEADSFLSPGVSPGNGYVGFMLPYTPLHHLLFAHPAFDRSRLPDALVMTSGNLSEEPIVVDNAEATEKLSGLADGFLLHDRDIYMRVDDSVARVVTGVPRLVRRARGYVPAPMDMGRELPEILACGPELKNTLTITKGRYAIMSQHIGDLTNYEAMSFFEETLKDLKRTFKADPGIVAHDMHPDYLSTRFARGYKRGDAPCVLVPVQHHHAHIASCMAENGYDGKVIGVALDGTGYGTDGRIWGSEFMAAGFDGFERLAHLDYVALPGGDKAVQEPWRLALSCLVKAYGISGAEVFYKLKKDALPEREIALVLKMITGNVNSPLSCGMGRLFDSVSSLTGLMDKITFEGEAAIALEMAATDAGTGAGSYPYEVVGGGPAVIDTNPLIIGVTEDILKGVSRGAIAVKFHNTVAGMVVRVCNDIREKTGLGTVALSGGVFQNSLLFGMVEHGLGMRGFRVLSHSKVPANDACVSLGQAAIAAASISE
jgi:hydrogenase maturation protein HypF